MNKPQCVPQLPQSSDCEKRQDQFQEVRDATFLSLLTFVLELLGFLEAYSQTARRPAKPLIRAHLRMAVNIAVLKQDVVYRRYGNFFFRM